MENKLIITPSTVISVELLKSLCEEYTAEIGAGEYSGHLSKIRIRYVMERGKFGYANFGDFFFLFCFKSVANSSQCNNKSRIRAEILTQKLYMGV